MMRYYDLDDEGGSAPPTPDGGKAPGVTKETPKVAQSAASGGSGGQGAPRIVPQSLPGCPVCLEEVALTPCVFVVCGHIVCAQCVVALEKLARKDNRAYRLRCPLCKDEVDEYTIPVYMRQMALEYGNFNAVQREGDTAFMRQHESRVRASSSSSSSSKKRKTVSAPSSRFESENDRVTWTNKLYAAIPRQLAPLWVHTGDQFRYRIRNAFPERVAPTSSLNSAICTRLRNRLKNSGIKVRKDGTSIDLTLDVVQIELFSNFHW